MLRGAFISLSKAQWAQRLIIRWKLAWRVASRFIAGETVEDALRAIRQLNERGILATLDQLGENTTNASEAEQAVKDILLAIHEIDRAGLKSNVSIKLTQLGLAFDAELAFTNLATILNEARQNDIFVRVDMEDSALTQKTLDMVRRARDAGFENVGVVIQSYLYRSAEDTRELIRRGVPVRLVKGAYREPASLAYPKKQDVDRNFDHLTTLLIEGSVGQGMPSGSANGRTPPLVAIASHDEKRIRFAIQAAEGAGLPKAAIEFQMLYGIQRDLQERLVAQGFPVRVYIPYGTHWYPYFMRRFAERPANVWFFISFLFKR